MIWLACDSCVIALQPLWRSPPENMDMSWDTCAACWRPERLMCCRRTRLVAEALPGFCKWRHCARHFMCLFPRTPLRRCIPISAAQPLLYATWNTFTITFALNMFFDGIRPPVNGELLPDLSRPGMGIE